MNILIGLGSGLVFFLCFLLAFYIGYKLGNTKVKHEEVEATEKEIEEHKRRIQGMQNILSYDINTAMGVKHE